MAKCTIKLPDNIYKSIEKLSDKTNEILNTTLEAGGKVVLKAVQKNLRESITNSSLRSTGELQNSLGLSAVKVNIKGITNIKIGFSEPRRKQYVAKKKRSYYTITNALIATVLEYGKSGQPARPFMRPAKISSKKASIEVMKSVFNEEIKKLGGEIK